MAAVDSLLEPVAVTDKHLFCVEMMKRLDTQRRNEQFCDVILEVGSGDDRARLQAHRLVLCAASPFFHNALNSDMKEKKEGLIRLEETSRAVMEEVLEYLYTGYLDISEANACNLLAAADYFIIPSLKNLCGKVILQGMSLTNCVAAYCLSLKYQCEELKKGSRDFIHANFVAVAETEDFLNLSKQELVEWISSDEIIVKGEEEVFEVLKKWATRNKSRKKSFNDLFGHIRCIYVPRDYLSNVILSDPMVKENRDCSNLALDAMKLMFSGQEECYFAQAPRNCLKRHEDAIVACGVKNTWCYISSQKQWYKLAHKLSKRIFWSPNVSPCQGKLFHIGNSNGKPAECYDPLVNTWSTLKSFQQSTCIKYCTVVTFQGLLHVIGGVDQGDNRLSSVQRYNPDTNLWQEMPSISSPRSSVCAVSDGSHLYVIGGNTNSGSVKTAERFDPQDKAWSGIASTLEKRNCAGGAAVNHNVFVFGGIRNATALNASFCEMYDPAVDEWNSIAIAVAPKSKFTSAVSFKGKIFVSGVFEQDGSPGIVSKLYIYDTVTNEWTCCSEFPNATEKFSIARLRIPKEILATCEVLS